MHGVDPNMPLHSTHLLTHFFHIVHDSLSFPSVARPQNTAFILLQQWSIIIKLL